MRSGYFKETIAEHVNLTDSTVERIWLGVLAVGLIAAPLFLGPYEISLVTLVIITIMGATGLNILTGWTGLISLGHVAFMMLGAYGYAVTVELNGWHPVLGFVAAGVVPGLASILVGAPSLRLTGLYLAITTLAFSFIANHLVLEFDDLTRGARGIFVNRPEIAGVSFASDAAFYYLATGFLALTLLVALNIKRSRIGRAFVAIRDNDTAAQVMGVNLSRFKLYAFIVSAVITGLSGALYGMFLSYVTVDGFPFLLSIEALAILIVGGLGSILGVIFGAVFVLIMPEVIAAGFSLVGEEAARTLSTGAHELKSILYGLVIILFLRFQPRGLVGLWRDVKRAWVNWPLRF